MQNDSVIAFTVVAALLAASVTLLSASLAYFVSIGPTTNNTDLTKFLFAIIPGIAALLLIRAAITVHDRFRDTGMVRHARAVQIEQELRIHSFRLFSPWVQNLQDVPPGYFPILGQIAWNSEGKQGTLPPGGFDNYGRTKHLQVIYDVSFTRSLHKLKVTTYLLFGSGLAISLIRVLVLKI